MESAEVFQDQGHICFDGYLSGDVCQEYIGTVEKSGKFERVVREYPLVEKVIAGKDVSAGGKFSSHFSIDRMGLEELLPDLAGLYKTTLEFVIAELGQNYLASPYERSAFYLKKYCAPGDKQGWHYDMNCLTALVYLTDNQDGYTQIIHDDGREFEVEPKEGRMLILDGSRIWHRAQEVTGPDKVTLLFCSPSAPMAQN